MGYSLILFKSLHFKENYNFLLILKKDIEYRQVKSKVGAIGPATDPTALYGPSRGPYVPGRPLDGPRRPWLKYMKINDFGVINLIFRIFKYLNRKESVKFILVCTWLELELGGSEKTLKNFINNLIGNIKIRYSRGSEYIRRPCP